MTIKSLDELPLTAAYLRRIGAKAVNFKRATIQGMEGRYPKPLGSIDFHADGSMSFHGQVDAPARLRLMPSPLKLKLPPSLNQWPWQPWAMICQLG